MTDSSRGALEMDIKSVNDTGKFTAIFSVFGNIDRDNERVMPGALDRSVAALKLKGAPIPVLFGHDGGAFIGAIRPTDIRTTKTHAEADGQLDLSSRLAQEAHTMMREGLLTKFSFGYNERVARMGTDGVRELHDLDLGEVSVTSRPANPATELLSVKSADEPELDDEALDGAKAGRRLSKASEAQLNEIAAHYRQGLDMIAAFLGTAEDAPAGKSETDAPAVTDGTPVPEQLTDQEPQAKSRDELTDRVNDELASLQLLKEKRNDIHSS